MGCGLEFASGPLEPLRPQGRAALGVGHGAWAGVWIVGCGTSGWGVDGSELEVLGGGCVE